MQNYVRANELSDDDGTEMCLRVRPAKKVRARPKWLWTFNFSPDVYTVCRLKRYLLFALCRSARPETGNSEKLTMK